MGIFAGMNTLTLNLSKSDVYTEVMKTTHYTGSKSVGEDAAAAFDRIAITEADRTMLDRYWDEAISMLVSEARQFVTSSTTVTSESGVKTQILVLTLPSNYDPALDASIEKSAYSFLVNYIVSKWNMAADRQDVAPYSAEAAAMLQDIRTKIYYRRKPTRTIIKN